MLSDALHLTRLGGDGRRILGRRQIRDGNDGARNYTRAHRGLRPPNYVRCSQAHINRPETD
jgi:hypothetical protein